jgi:hypothetical protein
MEGFGKGVGHRLRRASALGSSGTPQMVRTDGNLGVASLATGDTTVASLATDDSCVASRTAGDSPSASRIIGDLTQVIVGSARVASGRMVSAGVASARPSVSAPNPKAKKGRGSGEVKKGRGKGKLLLLAVCQLLQLLIQEEGRG